MQKQVFSWNDLPEELGSKQRYALWRDTYTSRYGAADFVPREDGPFYANCELIQFGRIGVTRFDCSARYFKRTQADVAVDARDDFLIGFNRDGAIRGRTGRKELHVPSGGAIAFTNAEPLYNEFEGWAKVTGLSLPRAQLAALIDAPEDMTGALNGESAAARHLKRYADFLLDEVAIECEPRVIASVETMLLDLIALALGAGRDVTEQARGRGLRAARLQEVLGEIKSGYARADFSPAAVARKLGLSPRYIQDLLHETGATLSERVLELRLQKARALLADFKNDRLKVSDIALASGFGDVSYFNQAFRRRFGCTPTQVRAGQGEHSAPDR